MPEKENDQTENGVRPSGSILTKTVFDFFSSVLKSIATDDLLRVLWGVEVLLFLILAFMIWFGDVTGDQRFYLALIVIASVVCRSEEHTSELQSLMRISYAVFCL